jgi:hypothetical protein
LQTFPEVTGPAMTGLGFRENPDELGMPLEFSPARKFPGDWKASVAGSGRMLTCMACHLGQLPDGRLSIGMPNERLDLGKFNALIQYPMWLVNRKESRNLSKWDPQSTAFYEGLWNASKGRLTSSRLILDATALLGLFGQQGLFYWLVGQEPPPLTDQRTFFKSRVGTLNPAAPMLSDPENEIYMSAPPIWKMQHFAGQDIGEPYLGRITSSRNLEEFIRQAFVFSTLSTESAIPKYVDPIAAYLRQLQSPRALTSEEPPLVTTGANLFSFKCVGCHNGYEGSTKEAHSTTAANSPNVFNKIFANYTATSTQAKLAWAGLQKVGVLPLAQSGLKSRRLTGIWARSRLGYNGAVEGLDHLFCMAGKKRQILDVENPQADSMHRELCTDLSQSEKLSLSAFLRQSY